MHRLTEEIAYGMNLIIDAGGTKLDCLVLDDGVAIFRFNIGGVNPLTANEDDVKQMFANIQTNVVNNYNKEPNGLYYFGAGCSSPKIIKRVEQMASEVFTGAKIKVGTDIELAAELLIGKATGVAAILGTGSNAILCENGNLTSLVPSLGYILGDEAGGAGVGKKILALNLRNQLPQEISDIIYKNEAYRDKETIFSHVYQCCGSPAKYLGGVVKLIWEGLSNDPNLKEYFESEIINPAMDTFYIYNLQPYRKHTDNLAICGSIASTFRQSVLKYAKKYNWEILKIVQSPLDALAQLYK